jgi:fructosamine-3-kinase
VREIERAATAHRGRPWSSAGLTRLDARAAHPAGIHRGEPFSVFAKLDRGSGAHARLTAEAEGLALIGRRRRVRTPVPVGHGVIDVDGGSLLLSEAVTERPAELRSAGDYVAIGRTLATLHQVSDARFGLAGPDGYFGPFRQDNRPVPGNTWAAFYAERRVRPLLRVAVDSGELPAGLAAGVERIIERLPSRAGPEPLPALLHGDAQQNNFISAPDGAVVIDACPYFGHPEVDLALLGYFRPVPAVVMEAYRELRPLEEGFAERTELWRLFGYLAVIAADGAGRAGRDFLARLAAAIARYA